MALVFKEEYYDAIKPYLPEDAKNVIYNQLPKIKERIESEIDTFAKSFAEQIHKQVSEQTAAMEQEAKDLKAKLQQLSDDLTKATDAAPLKDVAVKMAAEVEQYRQKMEGLGKTVRQTVLTAARYAGLPIPPGLAG